MAKPTKTKAGTWTMRVYAYTDAYGTKHYKRITADTKAECEYLAAKFKTSERKQAPKTKLTVGDAVDQYISPRRTGRSSTGSSCGPSPCSGRASNFG